MIVLYDELDFPLGRVQVKERGSANGHNGVKSISAVLGTEEWLRIRIGVGKMARVAGTDVKVGGTEYLLSPFRKADLLLLEDGLDLAVRAVETVLGKGIGAAMNEFNRRTEGKQM